MRSPKLSRNLGEAGGEPDPPGRLSWREMDAAMPARQDLQDGDAAAPAELVPLNPRVRRLWWVRGAVVVLQLTVLAAVIDWVGDPPTPRGLVPLGVALLGAAVVAVSVRLRYARWRYAVREADLWIRSGLLWVTISVIPLSRLQFVDTRQGPLERYFRLSSLVVHTAALGTSGKLPGLDVEEAERLRERLARVEFDVAGI